MNFLEQFGIIPIDYSTIVSAQGNYKSPRDKVAGMEKNGTLIRLKKGLYVVSPSISRQPLSKELIANHLYGPSYISLESALSYYGLIPERVQLTQSMTLKRTKYFSNNIGDFSYSSLHSTYYQVGIRQEVVENQYAFLIATPEKALCDLIIQTAGLRLQSVKSMQNYLEEDLRIDFSVLEGFNIQILKECIETGSKKTELKLLLKIVDNERI